MRGPKNIIINGKQLSEILESHKKWLLDEEGYQRADLRGAYLQGAENADLAAAVVTIVPEGEIIGWKKLENNLIAKLLIPSAAKRSNATGRKCRAEYAVVLEIWKGEEKVETGVSEHDNDFVYRVGKTVKPTEPFDENRWEECASGIHFFITRIEAEEYN